MANDNTRGLPVDRHSSHAPKEVNIGTGYREGGADIKTQRKVEYPLLYDNSVGFPGRSHQCSDTRLTSKRANSTKVLK